MTDAVAYEAWYKKFKENQVIEQPIDTTLDGVKCLLSDSDVDDSTKHAAAEFIRRTKYKYWASNLFALVCSLGAAFSAMAYFLLIRGHTLSLNEWEYLIAPSVVGLFVAGATWYTYRHDTAEGILDFKFEWPKSFDSKDICISMLTVLVVAMEVALSGYGMTELNLGEAETSLVWFVCLSTLIPEWAQTYKYMEKWFREPEEKEEYTGSQKNWLNFYRVCSYITLAFWGMAIFPLIEEYSSTAVAAAAVGFYIMMGKPYMKEKAKDQVKDQFKAEPSTGCYNYWYPISRLGNGLGDLASSAFGFFEALKAFGLMKEDAKPIETFEFSGDTCYQTWVILLSAVVVVGGSCVGSFLMSAGGDQDAYGPKIEAAENAAPTHNINKDIEGRPPPANKPVFFSNMWHTQKDLPLPKDVKKKSTIAGI